MPEPHADSWRKRIKFAWVPKFRSPSFGVSEGRPDIETDTSQRNRRSVPTEAPASIPGHMPTTKTETLQSDGDPGEAEALASVPGDGLAIEHEMSQQHSDGRPHFSIVSHPPYHVC